MLAKVAAVSSEERARLAAHLAIAAQAENDSLQANLLPRRATLAYLALGLVFFMPAPNLPVPGDLALHRMYILHSIVSNVLPAIAVYLLLRLTRLHSLLKSRPVINRMLGVLGFILLVYFPVHFVALFLQNENASTGSAFTRSLPDSNFDYLVAGFQLFAVTVSAFLLLASSLWLLARSISLRAERTMPPPFDSKEKQLVAGALGLSVVCAALALF